MIDDRKFWLDAMLRIASPTLENLARGELNQALPRTFHADRAAFACLEAFGRTAQGIAPWLELEGLQGEEAERQAKYRLLMRACLDKATDPASSDFMNFGTEGAQPLVDAAFLSHAILRAPNQMGRMLEPRIRANLIAALKTSRQVQAYENNWLFFAAMVEAALHALGDDDVDFARVEYAVNRFEDWYVGDGLYGDGPDFHADYYNSFVIHPMYVDVVRAFAPEHPQLAALWPQVEARALRYAQILEKLIAPDGTYPIIGRSIAYRFGAFHMLAQAALMQRLEPLPPAQVRCALQAVIARVMESGAMFDENGWLLPGIVGDQPALAEGYINTGSLYLCCAVFLPLGLGPETPFWADAPLPWSSRRVWGGEDMPADHAMRRA